MESTQSPASQGSVPNISPEISITNVTKTSGGKKAAWFFGILSFVAIAASVAFAVLYFLNPKSNSTQNSDTNTNTNNIADQDTTIPTPSEITTLLEENLIHQRVVCSYV